MSFPTDPEKQAETRRKMSESAKRRAADPTERKMMSERTKQQFADPIARKAASERTKQQMADPVARAFIDDRRREALKTPETRAKMSESTKKRLADPEVKRQLDAIRAEAMRRPEVRAKASENQRQVMADPARREHLSQKAIEQFSNPTARLRQSELAHLQFSDPEAGKAHGAWLKEFYTRPESDHAKQRARETLAELRLRPGFVEKQYEAIAKARKYSRTDIECIVETLLQAIGVEYEAQKRIGWWIVDFYVPSKNLIIECDGDYWHSLPAVQARDIRKNLYFERKGYLVVRLLGSHILTGKMESLEQLFA